jgi:hypothetical protein
VPIQPEYRPYEITEEEKKAFQKALDKSLNKVLKINKKVQ